MNTIIIKNISDKYVQLEEFFSPVSDLIDKIKNHFLKPKTAQTITISEISQEAIVSLVKNDCAMQLTKKNVTVCPSIIQQLQEQAYTLLLNESKLSDKQILDECYLQVECVKDKKSIVEVKASMAFSKIFAGTISFIHNIFDTAPRVLGFYDFGQEVDDIKEANDRLNLYMKIIAYPAVLFTLAVQVVSIGMALAITATIIAATILAAGAYIMYFKPCPSSVKQFVNLTAEAEMGNLTHVLGRTKEINALIGKLRNNESVLCVGNSGVGKSEIIKGLAIRIANGEVPAELKGKKLFTINTARLVGAKPATTLSKVEKRLAGYEKDVIIFFDEFHAAWCEDKKVSQDLKTFMDRFPNCIGATTLEEFHKYEIGKDAAIIRRMGIAPDASNGFIVHAMKPPQAKMVLRDVVETIAPNVEVKDEILSYLIERYDQKLCLK